MTTRHGKKAARTVKTPRTRMKVDAALRAKLCPGVIGKRIYAAADAKFIQLYNEMPSANALAAYLGRSISFVNQNRRRLGLPSKESEYKVPHGRAPMAHVVTIGNETKPLSVWCHAIYDIPTGMATRCVSVVMARFYRKKTGKALFASISGIKYSKNGVEICKLLD